MVCHLRLTKSSRGARTDNFVFYLYYRVSVLLVIALSFIITCRLVFGYSFQCIETDIFSGGYLERTCYSRNVFVNPVDQTFRRDRTKDRYQTFYSWVNLFLLVHAVLLYLPHLLWKYYESGRVQHLISGIGEATGKEDQRNHLAKYVVETRGMHEWYLRFYVLFEACNFSSSLVLTLWLVRFFDVTGFPDNQPLQLLTLSDFENFYFPPEGLCPHQRMGRSGDMLRASTLCILPLNHLFMYIFLFLFAWYIFLTVLSGIVLLYRFFLLTFAKFRRIRAPLVEHSILLQLCRQMSYGDWFFLTRLQKSLTEVDFAELVKKISAIRLNEKVLEDASEANAGISAL